MASVASIKVTRTSDTGWSVEIDSADPEASKAIAIGLVEAIHDILVENDIASEDIDVEQPN